MKHFVYEMVRTMNLTEFAESREIRINALSNYISRHPDLFKNHVKRIGKTVELDEDAIKILNTKYPVPKPVQIIKGIPQEEYNSVLKKAEILAEKLAMANDMIAKIQTERIEEQKELADLKSKKILLEDKELQLKKAEDKAAQSEKEKQELLRKYSALYEKNREYLEKKPKKSPFVSLFSKTNSDNKLIEIERKFFENEITLEEFQKMLNDVI